MTAHVAIFDADLPPGLAFIRSLGRAAVPTTVFTSDRRAMGATSRYAVDVQHAPSVHETDRFIGWLADRLHAESFDLIAPTSDYVMFAAAKAAAKVGVDVGHPAAHRVLDCLFKRRFATAVEAAGFPALPVWAPTSVPEALEVGRTVGYPLVLKPRTHIAVGIERGRVVRSAGALADAFRPYVLDSNHSEAVAETPDIAWPLIQRYVDPGHARVHSITGCLGRHGDLLSLGHSRKLSQWGPPLGIGTEFEAIESQPFTQRAVDAVRQVLGEGIFELEVLVDRRTDEVWAIDLNPRGFGQMSLDIARGHDLPMLWYRSVTGARPTAAPVPSKTPTHWRMAVHRYIELAARVATDPSRSSVRSLAQAVSSVRYVHGVHDWRDPRPTVRWMRRLLKHPRSLVRPYAQRTTM